MNSKSRKPGRRVRLAASRPESEAFTATDLERSLGAITAERKRPAQPENTEFLLREKPPHWSQDV